MSNTINDELMERAAEVKTYYEGTDLETALDNLISRGDLEALQFMVSDAEAEMARQEFYANDMIGANDVF